MTRPMRFPIISHSLSIALCAVTLSVTTLAHAEPPKLTQRVQTPIVIHPGTPVTMVLDVTHPLGTRLNGPTPPESIRWKIIKTTPTTTNHKDHARTVLSVDVAAWRPTAVQVPAMEVQVVGADDSTTLKTTAFSFTVTSTLPAPDAEPKTPHAPVSILVQDLSLLWVGLVAGAALLGVGALVLVSRRRRDQPTPKAAPRAPRAVALERLTALSERTDASTREEFLSFYTEMSDAVRVYLGHTFSFPGAELTTTEITPFLRAEQWPKSLGQEDIIAWMHKADRFKYTEAHPNLDDAQLALRTAFSIVELTHHHQEILAEEQAQQPPVKHVISHKQDDTVPGTTEELVPGTKLSPETKDTSTVEPTPTTSAHGFAAWEAIAKDAEEEADVVPDTKHDVVPGTMTPEDSSEHEERHD